MKTFIASSAALFAATASAEHLQMLPEALPKDVEITSFAPVFDFDSDSCLPSAAIDPFGKINGGLKPTGHITGACRHDGFMGLSNTYHRYACHKEGDDVYCSHFYGLYFQKDQCLEGIRCGHRHDFEKVAVWTKNGDVTDASASAHSGMETRPINEVPMQGTHPKIVYHKDGFSTHAFRFAKTNERAENPEGAFVTPAIASWTVMTGETVDNAYLRNALDTHDFGSANFPVRSDYFVPQINKNRPSGYPEFVNEDMDNLQK